MVLYGFASEAYKLIIFTSIIFFLSELSPILGLLGLALYSFSSFAMPMINFLRYLLTNAELAKTRVRAIAISSLMIGSVLYLFGGIKISDKVIVDGVIEPVQLQQIHVHSDGFVNSHINAQTKVEKNKSEIYRADNPELDLKISQAEADIDRLTVLIRAYAGVEPARKIIHQNSYNALLKRIELLTTEISMLKISAPISGLFIPETTRDLSGKFMHKGQKLGMIVSPTELTIRSVISQDMVRILEEANSQAEFRLRGRPEQTYKALIESRQKAGSSKLPSAALGYMGGGEIDVKQTEQGTETKEFFFEIILKPDGSPWQLRPGQIVSVRFQLQDKTAVEMLQGFINRLLLRRFRI
ncbi:MAG: hypothetical protein HRT88_21530 [Lentisphaeraceae bacterium]|nr:hypothetical protein [Lentisphaeraceae bacterium]